jgi:hypothetical protein
MMTSWRKFGMSNIHTYIIVDPLDGMAHRRVSAVLSEITDSSETMVVDNAVRFTSGCDAGQWSCGRIRLLN